MKRLSAILLIISLLLAPSMFSSCSSDEVPDDFYFTISWGVNGDSYYNSKTGDLRRSRDDSENASDYSTTLVLSEEDMKTIYDLITEFDLDSQPDEYNGANYKPQTTLQLAVHDKNYSKTITVTNPVSPSKASNESERLFYALCDKILEIITSTEEWESLPYHLYM